MYKPEYGTRHADLINPEAYNKKIIVVGAGAIGSFVVLALAKMGYSNIKVYDFDTVEVENISSQFYPTSEICQPKVEALQRMIFDFTGTMIEAHNLKIEPHMTLDADIVISAVDNMAVRKMLFEISNCYWLIDPRMAAEYATMEVVNVQDEASRENYKRTLFTDGEAVQERCTAKTTIYTVLLIAGQVVKAVKDITNKCTKIEDWTPEMEKFGGPQEPITSLDWNISKNAMMAFSNGRKL